VRRGRAVAEDRDAPFADSILESYVVRIYRRPGHGTPRRWTGTVEDTRTGLTGSFRSLAGLRRWLERATRPNEERACDEDRGKA